ncbi:hypothetical protein J2Y40_003407 [Chryseobacterium sp. 2987]|nr:hypothetical protein [Chryseobacterium sp. 2987]
MIVIIKDTVCRGIYLKAHKIYDYETYLLSYF